MNTSIRHLRALVTLAELQNFTRAAAASHLSQPAFSALISGLEASIGLRLFDRSTRSVALTAEGRDLLASARRVVEDFDLALAGARDRAALRTGKVSLAVLPSLAARWLPPLMATFRQRYPGVDIAVADVLSDTCNAMVLGGQADFALATTSLNVSSLQFTEFCKDDFFLVCQPAHPIAKLSRIRPSDLVKWPFIHLVRSSSVRQYVDAVVHPLQLQMVMEVGQLTTVIGMVSAGLGISVVPGLALFQFDHPGVITRRLSLTGMQRTIYLVTRRDRSLSLPSQSFYRLIIENKPLFEPDPESPANLAP